MAYSIQREVSDGTLQTLTLRIAYFKKTHIFVYVDDKLADGSAGYSWVWDGERIRLNKVVPVGIEVMIRRKTPTDAPFHNFRQGAVFKDVTMDENFIQQLYINQENVEGLSATDFYSELDLHNYRVKNVGTAINDADAVSLGQYRADALGANQYRILAESSKVAAKASEVASAASAAAALISENKAKVSETAAKLSAVNSKESEDIVVPLVPIVAEAAREAAAASAQAATASTEAKQAVSDVKNLGAVPIGAVLDFTRGSIPAGYLIANGSTFDAATYPDLQAFLGSNKLPNVKARIREMFSVEWWGGTRSAIPAGAVPADGQVLNASVYPDAATEITKGSNSSVPVVAEAVWAIPTNRGCYTKANGSQFRVPDYNGKLSDSIGAVFLRGDGKNSAGAAGLMQGDAIRNISGALGSIYGDRDSAAPANGVFRAIERGVLTFITADAPAHAVKEMNLDASRAVPTANENRPVAATGCWIIWLVLSPVVPLIKAAGALANEGMAQLDGVLGRVGDLEVHNRDIITPELVRLETAKVDKPKTLGLAQVAKLLNIPIGDTTWDYSKLCMIPDGTYWFDGSNHQNSSEAKAFSWLGVPDKLRGYHYGNVTIAKSDNAITFTLVPHKNTGNFILDGFISRGETTVIWTPRNQAITSAPILIFAGDWRAGQIITLPIAGAFKYPTAWKWLASSDPTWDGVYDTNSPTVCAGQVPACFHVHDAIYNITPENGDWFTASQYRMNRYWPAAAKPIGEIHIARS